MRRLNLVSSSALMVALCTLLACGGAPQKTEEPNPNDPQSGSLEGAPATSEDSDSAGNPLDNGKVTICHIPPGNPANAHTITVGLPAVKAHLKHGDTLGACGGTGGEEDAGTGGETDAGTGGETDAGTGSETDAGVPACGVEGDACSGNTDCCDGLTCGPEGMCEPIIG